ncbi:MAG: DUF6159 family protein [Anaerolineae bacterium]|nr:DUF6159 family protein [Anaerolineae bacterium]
MFGSFSRSWQLVKASWAVLKADKELILFPIISSITLVIVSIIMFIPSAIIAFSLDVAGLGEGGAGILGYIGLFISYFVSYTIIIYFNTGLIGAAMIRLDGGDPTLSDGFRIANERISKILAYAAISATVGVILRIIEERAGFIGDIIASIIGFAWNLATFLVIPVLVSTDMGPIEAVKHSGSLLKKTWGEQITGNFSIGGIFFLFYLLVIVVGGLLAFAIGSMTGSAALVGIVIVLIVAAVLVLATIQGALSGIYQAALYRYAALGVAPDNFDIETIEGAFKPKRKRGMF